MAVTFSGSAPIAAPLTFSWTFGDGGTASGATATHAYNAANTYTATSDRQGRPVERDIDSNVHITPAW